MRAGHPVATNSTTTMTAMRYRFAAELHRVKHWTHACLLNPCCCCCCCCIPHSIEIFASRFIHGKPPSPPPIHGLCAMEISYRLPAPLRRSLNDKQNTKSLQLLGRVHLRIRFTSKIFCAVTRFEVKPCDANGRSLECVESNPVNNFRSSAARRLSPIHTNAYKFEILI